MNKIKKIQSLVIGEGISLIVSFLLLPYLAKALHPIQYGSFGQIIFYVDIFKSIALMGLHKVIFIYLNENNEDKDTIVLNNLCSCLFSGILILIICICLEPLTSYLFKNTTIKYGIIFYALSIPFQIGATCLSSILVFKNKTTEVRNVVLFTNLLRYFTTFISIQFHLPFECIFIGISSTYLIQFLIMLYFADIKLDISKINYDLMKNQIYFGVPLGLTSLLGTLYYFLDSFLVSTLLNVKDYAIFRNGTFQIPFLSSLYGIIGLVIMPDLSRYYYEGNKKQVVKTYGNTAVITAVFLYPILLHLILYSKFFFKLLFLDIYQVSIPIFMIYNIMLVFRVADFESLIILTKHSNILPKIYLLSIITNLFLGILFTLYWGVVGTVCATIVSFIILVWLITNKSSEYLETKTLHLFQLSKILKVFFISLFFSVNSYLISVFWESNIVLVFIILMLTTLANYHFVLKSNIIDTSTKMQIFNLLKNKNVQIRLKNLYIK